MKRKFLEDLGLEKEAIDKIMNENGKDIEDTKKVSEQTKKELEQAQEQLGERDKQLEELKKSSGDNVELQKQITDLQAENERIKQEKDAEIKELKLSTAIKAALGDSAQDSELVAGLLDRSRLILGDDGKVTGLDEQVKSIKESKPFLFKTEKPNEKKPGFHPIGAGGAEGKPKLETKDGAVDMKSAIAAKIQAQLPPTN